jgi:2-oxo-4-hydroxy-4-carboxy-5-ureidoimidazoline decarboxylase
MTIEALNSLDREGFIDAVGWVFEESPWVAERAWNSRIFRERRFPASGDGRTGGSGVERRTVGSIASAPRSRHPRPRPQRRARVSVASGAEQAGAGLDRLTPPEFERLQRLNTEYRDKFGFPFLFAVKGSTKHDILRALEQRLEDDPEQEYREALRQVFRIARFRIEDSIS